MPYQAIPGDVPRRYERTLQARGHCFELTCAHQIYAGRSRCSEGQGFRILPGKSQKVPFGPGATLAEPRSRRGHGEDSMYVDRASNCWVIAMDDVTSSRG